MYVAFVGACIAGSNGLYSCAGTSTFAVKIQFPDHDRIRFILPLISGMSQLLRI